MRCIGLVSLALAITFAAGCDRSERRAVEAPASDQRVRDEALTGSDADFVHDIAIANMAEIELGKIAMERSSNAQIKIFGQMMVTDHTAAADKLTAVASEHNLTLPTQLDQRHIELRDKLSALQGPEFERAYMEAMVDGHVDVHDKLQSRIDKNSVADFSAKMGDRIAGEPVPEGSITVRPEKSDNPVTAGLNQWAAETFPTVHKHLADARQLDSTLKGKRPTSSS
jgi:putative membrane protein